MWNKAREERPMSRLAFTALLLCVLAAGSRAQEKLTQDLSRPILAPVDQYGLARVREMARGKVVLMNLWATWCTPCVEEFPALMRLRRVYGGKGFDVIFVSVDNRRKSEVEVLRFLRRMRVDFETYIKDTRDDEGFINAVHPEWSGDLPASFLYNTEGQLVKSFLGPVTFEEAGKALDQLLNK